MRSRVINVRSSGEKEAAILGRARASNSTGRYSLPVARCQMPYVSSLGDFGPLGGW